MPSRYPLGALCVETDDDFLVYLWKDSGAASPPIYLGSVARVLVDSAETAQRWADLMEELATRRIEKLIRSRVIVSGTSDERGYN